jgi:hypothetical protein
MASQGMEVGPRSCLQLLSQSILQRPRRNNLSQSTAQKQIGKYPGSGSHVWIYPRNWIASKTSVVQILQRRHPSPLLQEPGQVSHKPDMRTT